MTHVRQKFTLHLAGRFGSGFRLSHLGFDGKSLCYVAGHSVDQVPLLVRAPLQISIAAVATAVAIDDTLDVLLNPDPLHLRMTSGDVIRMDKREHRLALELFYP